ncbi:hypothetical protein ACFWYW_46550 [Nonomuraea sp. NPDC059023]|uniref:hypothetical protein n=1 Tax=unclassified Nonomuraea TaxID=2593643 RepID=UPI0036B1F942
MVEEPVLQSKARRAVWNADDHPRDRKGRWIETGAEVRIWGRRGVVGKVVRNVGGGRLEVEFPDGTRQQIHRNYLTVERTPDGNKPTGQADARPQPVPVEEPAEGAADFSPDTDGRISVSDLVEGDAVLVYGEDVDGNDVTRVGVVQQVTPDEERGHLIELSAGDDTVTVYSGAADATARKIPREDLAQLDQALSDGDPEADEMARELLARIVDADDREADATPDEESPAAPVADLPQQGERVRLANGAEGTVAEVRSDGAMIVTLDSGSRVNANAAAVTRLPAEQTADEQVADVPEPAGDTPEGPGPALSEASPGGKLILEQDTPDSGLIIRAANVRSGRLPQPLTDGLGADEARDLMADLESSMAGPDGDSPWDLEDPAEVLRWRSAEGYRFLTQVQLQAARWRFRNGMEPDPYGYARDSAARDDLARIGILDRGGRLADAGPSAGLPAVEQLLPRFRQLSTPALTSLASVLDERAASRYYREGGSLDRRGEGEPTWGRHAAAARQVLTEHQQATALSRQAAAKYKAGDVAGALADLDAAAQLAPNVRDWEAIRAKISPPDGSQATAADAAASADLEPLDPETSGGYMRAFQFQPGDSVFPGGRDHPDSGPELVEAVTDNGDGTLTLRLHTGQALTVPRNEALVRGGDLIARDPAGDRYGVTTRAAALAEGDWVELATLDREQLLQAGQGDRTSEGVIVRGRVISGPGAARIRLQQVTVHDPRTGALLDAMDTFDINPGARPARLDAAPDSAAAAAGRTERAVPDGGQWVRPGDVRSGGQVAIPLRGSHPTLSRLGLGPVDQVTVSGTVRDQSAVDQGWGGHDLLLDGGRWESSDGRSGDLPAGWFRLPAGKGLYYRPGTAGPGSVPVPADELAVGDVIPEGEITQVTRTDDYVFLAVRDLDDHRSMLALRPGQGVNRLQAGGGQAPEPVTITDVPVGSLLPGDRVLAKRGWEHAPATVTGLEASDIGNVVHVVFDNGSASMLLAVDGRVVKRLDGPAARDDDGSGDADGGEVTPLEPPRPDRLPKEVPAARPVLYTYQRANLVALGLDTVEDPAVSDAALRLRHRMPLSADHAAALADAVRQAAEQPHVKTVQRRALQRAAHRLDAAAAEARGVPAPELPPGRSAPEQVRSGNVAAGDVIAVPGAGEQAQFVTVRAARSMMRGRLVELEVEHADGTVETRVLTGRTDVWLLPDLPDDEPEEPPGGREHIHHSRLHIGDQIEWHGGLDGEPGVYTVVNVSYDSWSGQAEVKLQGADGRTRWEIFYNREGLPSLVRVGRGPGSSDQPWDGLMPDEDPVDVAVDEVRAGDLIRISDPAGDTVVGHVGAVTPVVGGEREAYAVWLTTRDGGLITRTLSPGDGKTITRLAASESYTRYLADARRQHERDETARKISEEFGAISVAAYKEHVGAAGQATDDDTPDTIAERIEASHRQRVQEGPSFQDRQRARRIADHLNIGDGEARKAAVARLTEVFGELRAQAKDHLIESIRQARPIGGEDRPRAYGRVLVQYYDNPPADRTTYLAAASTLAELAGLLDVPDSGADDDLARVPERGDGADIGARVDAYRKALGGGHAFGKRRLKRTVFKRTTFADLDAGRVPETEQIDAFIRDEAPDGGPGEHAMAHLALVRAAGRELDDVYQAKRAQKAVPLEQEQNAVDEELAELRRKIQRAELRWSQTWDAEKDRQARLQGFASYEAMHVARQAALDRRDNAEFDRLVDQMLEITRTAREQAETERVDLEADQERRQKLLVRQRELKVELGQANRDAAIELLREIRPDGVGGVQVDWRNDRTGKKVTGRSELVKSLRFAEESYPTSWLEAFRAHGGTNGWTIKQVKRGFYNDYMKVVALSPEVQKTSKGGKFGAVSVHEMGHGMERAVPGLLDAEWALLWARTSTGPVGSRTREKQTSIYRGTSEMGYRDEFPEHYTGKDYEGRAYEVFTTTIESLMGGSSYLDDDLRQWLLGVLALL